MNNAAMITLIPRGTGGRNAAVSIASDMNQEPGVHASVARWNKEAGQWSVVTWTAA